MVGDNPEIAISLSRGSQLWDHLDKSWSGLAPNVLVGPPHRYMVIPWQCRLIFLAVIKFRLPIDLLSPGFRVAASCATRGTELYDRATHLFWKTLSVEDAAYERVKQIMLQTDSTAEVESRTKLKNTIIPIMQFQGKDEFAYNGGRTLISDQPYFGRYNLFANDVCDLYPDAVGQDPRVMRPDLLKRTGSYYVLKLKESARLSRFCLIPDSAHFNVIENPGACADSIYDFIKSLS